jgi:hypothetical protein
MRTTTAFSQSISGVLNRVARPLAAALLLAGCSDFLDQQPPADLPNDRAITSAAGARAALAGAYAAMQSGSYYGGDYLNYNDLYADNALHSGTFTDYADAGANNLRADNEAILGIWNAIYDAIKRDNLLIQKVPGVPDLDPVERDQILGEAHLLRALHYHNLVRVFGGVPLRLTPVIDPGEAANIARSTVPEVYAQVVADLQQAEGLMTNGGGGNHASADAAKALLARVYLYQQDWANALAKADEVVAAGYSLAPVYSDLFDVEGISTPEDIFKLSFTAVQFTLIGYYWNSFDDGGRHELAPEPNLVAAYDPTDLRLAWDITISAAGDTSGTKWPTPIGAEDFHVIRFAEVLLTKAEAFAQLGSLDSAVATYNLIRARAGLADHVLGVDVTTQQQVLDAIDLERRLELAEEGDRFPDLVRTGRAIAVLGIQPFQQLFPIPAAEIDVAPSITQNPGY